MIERRILGEETLPSMPNEEQGKFSAWSVPDPRPDLAFPKLTEEMVERLRPFGLERDLPGKRLFVQLR